MPMLPCTSGGISAFLERADDLAGFFDVRNFHDDPNMLLGRILTAVGVVDIDLCVGQSLAEDTESARGVLENDGEHFGFHNVKTFLQQERLAGGGIAGHK